MEIPNCDMEHIMLFYSLVLDNSVKSDCRSAVGKKALKEYMIKVYDRLRALKRGGE